MEQNVLPQIANDAHLSALYLSAEHPAGYRAMATQTLNIQTSRQRVSVCPQLRRNSHRINMTGRFLRQRTNLIWSGKSQPLSKTNSRIYGKR